jgi:hypothetical protein
MKHTNGTECFLIPEIPAVSNLFDNCTGGTYVSRGFLKTKGHRKKK